MVEIAQKEINKLKKFAEIVKARKPLSTRAYTSLMASKTIPKYILKHVHFYYNNYKQWGGQLSDCLVLWRSQSLPDTCPDISQKKNIGEGAFGTVYDLGDSVIKIFDKVPDSEKVFLNHLATKLPIIFPILEEYQVYTYLLQVDGYLAYKMNKLERLPIAAISKFKQPK